MVCRHDARAIQATSSSYNRRLSKAYAQYSTELYFQYKNLVMYSVNYLRAYHSSLAGPAKKSIFLCSHITSLWDEVS